MCIDNTTLISTSLILSFIIIILVFLFNRIKIIKLLGGKCILAILLLVIFRSCAPFKFPFLIELPSYYVMPFVIDILLYEIPFGGFTVTAQNLFIAIWLSIAFVILIYKTVLYKRVLKNLHCLLAVTDKRILDAWDSLKKEFPKLSKVKLVKINCNISPFTIGTIHPFIVIPDKPFSSDKYTYILRHEAYHYLHKDNLIKVIAELLKILYWWNPLFILLEKTVFHILEVMNDRRLSAYYSEEEISSYVMCLVEAVYKIQENNVPFALSFSETNCKELKRRIHLITNNVKNSKRGKSILTVSLTGMILIFSCFFWNPSGTTYFGFTGTPDDGGFWVTPENGYFMEKGNGKYDLIYKGKYLLTTDYSDLENHDQRIKVYPRKLSIFFYTKEHEINEQFEKIHNSANSILDDIGNILLP